MTLKRVTPATGEPLSLAEIKSFIRVTGAEDDAYLLSLGLLANDYVEEHFGIAVQEYSYEWICAPTNKLFFPRGPLLRVSTVEVETATGWQVLASDKYKIVLGRQGYVQFKNISPYRDCKVRIRFDAGFENVNVIAAPIRQALLLLCGHFYENRDVVERERNFSIPLSVRGLLAPYMQVQL